MLALESAQGRDAGPPSTFAAVRRIVVPLDGTPYAERAVSWAVPLARGFGAEVVLVRADPFDTANPCGPAVPPRHRVRGRDHAASLYLARQEHELRRAGARVSSRAPGGAPGTAVVAAARECAADLIVIATHAGTTFSRPSQVSVAREVACTAGVPVLLLGSGGRDVIAPAGHSILRLLLPLTGSPGDAEERALVRHADLLARAFPCQTLVLRSVGGGVGDSGPSAPRPIGGSVTFDRVAVGLERLRTRKLLAGESVWTGLVYGDLVEEAARVAPGNADVILLGLPANLEERRRAANTAFRLVRQTTLPVLLVPVAARRRVVATVAGQTELIASDEGELAR